MSSDTQFTALGPAIIGFQTNGARIDKGVEAAGKISGVIGKGGLEGVTGEGSLVGVRGKGTSGVLGEGLIGIKGEGTVAGVSGVGQIGVKGTGVALPLTVGVEGESQSGAGVRGVSETGPGGEFISAKAAQLHLQPLPSSDPHGIIAGRAGDLLTTFVDGEASVSIWLCIRSGDEATAVWKRLAFS